MILLLYVYYRNNTIQLFGDTNVVKSQYDRIFEEHETQQTIYEF